MDYLKFIVFNGTGDFKCEYNVAVSYARPLVETLELYSKPPYTTDLNIPETKQEESNVPRRGRPAKSKPESGSSDDSIGVVTE